MIEAIRRYLFSQFGNPHGLVGRLAGEFMRRRPSNRARNSWTVDLLGLLPHHRVLEIGYGPGHAIGEVCVRLTTGRAAGLDRSATMAAMAAAQNLEMIRQDRLSLHVGSVEDGALDTIPELAGPFDRIFAVNVILFWPDPVPILRELAGRLAKDGRLFIALQPKSGDRSEAGVMAKADQIASQFGKAGLADIRIDRLATVTPMAICVSGAKAG